MRTRFYKKNVLLFRQKWSWDVATTATFGLIRKMIIEYKTLYSVIIYYDTNHLETDEISKYPNN